MLFIPLFIPLFLVAALASAPQGAGDEGLRARVLELVEPSRAHGIDYGPARALGVAAIPILDQMLEDETRKSSWSNIVTVVAMIGDSKSHDVLHRFIQARFTGEVDLPTFQALIAAQGMLGHIAAFGSDDLRTELEKGVDPAYWSTRLKWRYHHYEGERLHVLWSKLTINALAYTGTARAGAVLAALEKAPFSPTQVSNVVEGIARHAEIQPVGLVAYELRRDELRKSAH